MADHHYTTRDGVMFVAGVLLVVAIVLAFTSSWLLALIPVLACAGALAGAPYVRSRVPGRKAKGVVWLLPPTGYGEDDATEEEPELIEPLPASMVIGDGLFKPDERSLPS